MKIKICGVFREEDIDYLNEARPDYTGFVFAPSRRRVSPEQAARLRKRLDPGIISVGVFVNAPVEEAAALYRDGVIGVIQLHGGEDRAYIAAVKERSGAPVIQVLRGGEGRAAPEADYALVDGAAGGSGEAFDWELLKTVDLAGKPWFLAGGIGLGNLEKAVRLNPFGLDISSGAESGGVKDREKIIRLVKAVRGETG